MSKLTSKKQIIGFLALAAVICAVIACIVAIRPFNAIAEGDDTEQTTTDVAVVQDDNAAAEEQAKTTDEALVVPCDTQQSAVVNQNSNDVVTNGAVTNETKAFKVRLDGEIGTYADGWSADGTGGHATKDFAVGTPFSVIVASFAKNSAPDNKVFHGLKIKDGSWNDVYYQLFTGDECAEASYVDLTSTRYIKIVDTDGNAIEGAKCTAQQDGYNYDPYIVTGTTGENGLFSIKGIGGIAIVLSVTCDGYYDFNKIGVNASADPEYAGTVTLTKKATYKNTISLHTCGKATGIMSSSDTDISSWSNNNEIFSNSSLSYYLVSQQMPEESTVNVLVVANSEDSTSGLFFGMYGVSLLPTGLKYFIKNTDGTFTEITNLQENPVEVSGHLDIYCGCTTNNNATIICEGNDGVTFTYVKTIGGDVVANKTTESLNADFFRGSELEVSDNVITATGTVNTVSAEGNVTLTANIPDGKKFDSFLVNGEEITTDANITLAANDMAFLTVKTSDVVNPTPDPTPTPTPDGDSSAATSSSSSKTGDMTMYAVLGMLSVIALASCGIAVSRKIKFNK